MNLYDPIPPTTTAKLVRLTNVVGVETEPFDPETYQPQEDTLVDNEGKTRISTPFTNIIRWRKVIDPETGEEKVESNARMVKWSDGSWQLLIGNEAFNVTETDLGDRNEYLFARHPGAGLIQGQKKISSKLAFTPANLDSATHRQAHARHRHQTRQDEANAKVHRGDGSGARESRRRTRRRSA